MSVCFTIIIHFLLSTIQLSRSCLSTVSLRNRAMNSCSSIVPPFNRPSASWTKIIFSMQQDDRIQTSGTATMSTRSKRDRRRGKGFSRREKLVGLVILVLVLWVVYSVAETPPQTTQLGTGTGAPDFTLRVVGPNGLTPQTTSLSSFRGKIVVLEFMAPQCPHCQGMSPDLERLYLQYKPQNVVFLAISGIVAGYSVTPDEIAQFIRDYHSNWIYVYDSSGTIAAEYGVAGTPTFFIIGKNGNVTTAYVGDMQGGLFGTPTIQLLQKDLAQATQT
jgi:thiol-disulfide isomerase/thioredoxin